MPTERKSYTASIGRFADIALELLLPAQILKSNFLAMEKAKPFLLFSPTPAQEELQGKW